ncbi:hypothetical protein [Geothrix edaphica]|jgi:hypothetical protein|uniref:DUF1992 domain-containing protein n=1 Tax=Geothrix edaphica TaxID=2927976 RepID=A0ABQ5PXF9_9BACT|nr:hypothetical protein [Geothrix edaphica]GLH66746.1 hypothetical protein GETHED_11100 [Geothrix edaphica]
MIEQVERRKKAWSRIVGVERRAAPLHDLAGRPLPDPTRLEDEEFAATQAELAAAKKKASEHHDRWSNPDLFD